MKEVQTSGAKSSKFVAMPSDCFIPRCDWVISFIRKDKDGSAIREVIGASAPESTEHEQRGD